MAFIGRKMIKSERARMHQINAVFARIAKTMILLYACFLILVWVSERSVFKINSVEVEGTYALSAPDIEAIALRPLSEKFLFWIAGDNRVLYPRELVLREVESTYPRVARADISFPEPHRLLVHIEEYQPAFLYCMNQEAPAPAPRNSPAVLMSDSAMASTSTSTSVEELPLPKELPASVPALSDCYFADKGGYVFSRAPEYSGYPFLAVISQASSAPVSELPSPIGERILDPEDHSRITAFVSALDALSLRTHALYLRNAHDVEFETNMPWSILWATTEDPEESVRNLDVVLQALPNERTESDDTLNRIDLRFGNKVFYK